MSAPKKIDTAHVFQGELTGPKKRAAGFHSTAVAHPNAQTVGPVLKENPHSHVFEQAVQVRKDSASNWKDKRGSSTFFPADFSQSKVEGTLQRAYTAHQATGSNPVQVTWRRFADTAEESGGMMDVHVEDKPSGLRGFPVL